MPKEQKTFTREFKQEAVQLVRSSNKSQAQIARDLGIADSTLHHWCKVFAEDGEQAFPGSGHQKPQEEEIRRLKRELEITKQERECVHKALYPSLPRKLRVERTRMIDELTGDGNITRDHSMLAKHHSWKVS